MTHPIKVLLAAAAGIAIAAAAAEFSVTPVRIFMTSRDRAVAITLTNESDEEVLMQAELFLWKQKPDGQDELTPTQDLILSPPIVKLAPRATQVVRLARLGPPPAGTEETYRMIVREVPEAKPASKEIKLQLALAFSLPVFITPPGARRQLVCAMERVAPDTARASCENKGTAYAQARALALLAPAGERLAARDTGGYILPGVRRSFDIKRTEGKIPAGPVQLQVTLDDGTVQSFEATLSE